MPAIRPNRFLLEGIDEGHQYRVCYSPLDTEFPREPSPSLKRPSDPRPPRLRLQDLECVRTLGSGQYGGVYLVRTRRKSHPLDLPGSLFAVKAFKRRYMRALDSSHPYNKNTERSILAELPWHPFIVGMVDAFWDSRNLYLLLEFMPGGTLRSLIQKHAPMEATHAAFYFTNIVMAIEFLEEYGVIHRDLSPENILVGADGYLSLADFGTAAKYHDDSVTWLMVGTPTYMAPEVFEPQWGTIRTGIDWWSAGCILYEMTTRKWPFYGRSQSRIYQKAKRGKLHWPVDLRIGQYHKAIISGLLTVQAASRLGYSGVKGVKEHPWLAAIDWDKIRDKVYIAPHVPSTLDPTSIRRDQKLPSQKNLPGIKIAPVELSTKMEHETEGSTKRI